jgi:putative DNA primase/helicase
VEYVKARPGMSSDAIRMEIEALATGLQPVDLMEFHGSPILQKLIDVISEPVVWIWKYRIPLGKLTLLAGFPGLGKSLAACSIAAILSTGRYWPDRLSGPPPLRGSTIFLNYEDDPGDTLRPRLEAAGADLTRISILPTVRRRDAKTGKTKESLFNLEHDLLALELAIQRTPDCKLIVIDPISAATGKTDSNNNSEVRGLLAPLAKLAAKYKVAVLLVSHFNKTSGGPAINRSIGSIAFTAAARVAYGVVKDKTDPQRRLMLPIKNNLGPDSHGLAYRIVDSHLPGIPRVEWESVPCDTNIDDALSPLEFGSPSPKRDVAAEWLIGLISNGPIPAEEIFNQARKAGIKPDTVRRASESLNIQPKKSGFKGPWVWELPAISPEPAE